MEMTRERLTKKIMRVLNASKVEGFNVHTALHCVIELTLFQGVFKACQIYGVSKIHCMKFVI